MDLAEDAPAEGWVLPEAAYIHVPFCRHRCGYCNFSVIANRDDLIEKFLIAITQELNALERPRLKTLFLGGGTPTHLPNPALARLLESLDQQFDLSELTEFSVEANPEDISEAKLELLACKGVNRISLGVQSFQTTKLLSLERGHTGDQAIAAVELASQYIPNVSIDLIFAAPSESLKQWEQDVITAIQLPISHLSTYALTYEKGTQFWNQRLRGDVKELDESVEIDMYNFTRQSCQQNGFRHYEVSNFAKAGSRCLHNMAYWKGEGWYAAGPGAARFVNGVREVNHRSTSTYLKRINEEQSPVAEREAIGVVQYTKERAAFGIRLIDGIDLRALSQHVGFDTHTFLKDPIELSIDDGLLVEEGDHLRLSDRGILFADTVAQRFLDS